MQIKHLILISQSPDLDKWKFEIIQPQQEIPVVGGIINSETFCEDLKIGIVKFIHEVWLQDTTGPSRLIELVSYDNSKFLDNLSDYFTIEVISRKVMIPRNALFFIKNSIYVDIDKKENDELLEDLVKSIKEKSPLMPNPNNPYIMPLTYPQDIYKKSKSLGDYDEYNPMRIWCNGSSTG